MKPWRLGLLLLSLLVPGGVVPLAAQTAKEVPADVEETVIAEIAAYRVVLEPDFFLFGTENAFSFSLRTLMNLSEEDEDSPGAYPQGVLSAPVDGGFSLWLPMGADTGDDSGSGRAPWKLGVSLRAQYDVLGGLGGSREVKALSRLDRAVLLSPQDTLAAADVLVAYNLAGDSEGKGALYLGGGLGAVVVSNSTKFSWSEATGTLGFSTLYDDFYYYVGGVKGISGKGNIFLQRPEEFLVRASFFEDPYAGTPALSVDSDFSGHSVGDYLPGAGLSIIQGSVDLYGTFRLGPASPYRVEIHGGDVLDISGSAHWGKEAYGFRLSAGYGNAGEQRGHTGLHGKASLLLDYPASQGFLFLRIGTLPGDSEGSETASEFRESRISMGLGLGLRAEF